MPEEKNYENKIKKWLKDHNIYYFKFFANAYTKRGIPDLVCCINGSYCAIEVKASNGRISEIQKVNIMETEDNGGIAFVSYPSDYDETIEIFEKLLANDTYMASELAISLNTLHNVYEGSEDD